MATRKKRSDSVAAAIDAMADAVRPLPAVPSCVRVREGDRPFLNSILSSRLVSEWSESDIMVAAQLARTQADIETESLLLEAEGSVVVNDRGTNVMNARHTVLEQLTRRSMAMLKSLGMLGVVAKGDKRDIAKAREIGRNAKALKQELQDEAELLA
jgi:hypothetical protein